MPDSKQWLFLKKSVALNKISHAYLFSGPANPAKEKTARTFGQLLNCQSVLADGEPCGECLSCRQTLKRIHPDFLWLELTAEDFDSQINLIRNLIGWLSLKPALDRRKVAVINRLENFSFEAQSSLLKTLEEPAGQTVLVIISDCPDLLPKTIVSRCQEMKFPVLPAVGNQQKELTELIKPETPLALYFRKIKEVSEDKAKALDFLKELMIFFRAEFLKDGKAQAKFSFDILKKFLFASQETDYLLRRTNVSSRLALENLILNLF